ncbi:MAG: hypothetical protein ACKO3K_18655 [Cuspidothrix sp.]
MGFIKNLIGGILGFITGLFSKKESGYYLELKDGANTISTPVAPAAKPAAKPVVQPAAKPAAAAPMEAKATQPETVKPKLSLPTEANFATKYLIPSNSPRRRPGVNMNTFLDMARQVKTPG